MAVIEYTQGNLLQADAEALVNTVNCVGIMGRGVALQFKNDFPANFKAYKVACDHGEVRPGRMFVFATGALTNPKYIINFPTKRHWKGKSRMEDIEAGLAALVRELIELGVTSIAIPPLGSGLGGLHWPDVKHRIVDAVKEIPNLKVKIYEPAGAAPTTKSKSVPKMTNGRAALVKLLDRYLAGHMDPFVTLLEAHKLMYFMQEAGEHLRLTYAKAPYGPYAENLRHVLKEVEGHLVAGYDDGGDSPTKQLALVPGAIEDADSFLSGAHESAERLHRVADLVEGFETPFGLELLATVHWVATRDGARTAAAACDRVYTWNNRKKQFSIRQIGIAWDTLVKKGWIGSRSPHAKADA